MPDLPELTDADRDDALHLARDIVEAMRTQGELSGDLVIAINDDRSGELVRLAQYAIELEEQLALVRANVSEIDRSFDDGGS